MPCHDSQRLMHGYLDGELDLEASLAFEAHLRQCDHCRQWYRQQRALHGLIAQNARFYPAPAALKSGALQRLNEVDGRSAARARRNGWPVAIVTLATLLFWTVSLHFGNALWRQVAPSPEKVVYHITSGTDITTALRNVANYLEVSPRAKVVVVAHNKGVDFLLRGAKNQDGAPYEANVSLLVQRGVDFRVCGNTLALRHIDASQVIPEAHLVPSGIAEIGRLETQEGYSYMRL